MFSSSFILLLRPGYTSIFPSGDSLSFAQLSYFLSKYLAVPRLIDYRKGIPVPYGNDHLCSYSLPDSRALHQVYSSSLPMAMFFAFVRLNASIIMFTVPSRSSPHFVSWLRTLPPLSFLAPFFPFLRAGRSPDFTILFH